MIGRPYQLGMATKSTPDGRVRSWYNGRWGWAKAPKELKQHRLKNGYLVVNMKPDPQSPPQSEYVHRLMLLSWKGAPNCGQEARHLNGKKTDNRIENLEWGSRSENTQDQVKHGTFNYPVQYRW